MPKDNPKTPTRQGLRAFTAAELERMDFGEEPPPATEPRQIGSGAWLRLRDSADHDMIGGHGPYLSVLRKGYVSIWRFQDKDEARRAYERSYRLNGGTTEFLEVVGDFSERTHAGCDWWCLPPWEELGMRRPKAWSGRHDPKRRAEFLAGRYGEPDVDRARRAILKRAEKCSDCAFEAGAAHLAKLRKALGDDDRLSPSELLNVPLDKLM